jgi:hypothetical protein
MRAIYTQEQLWVVQINLRREVSTRLEIKATGGRNKQGK